MDIEIVSDAPRGGGGKALLPFVFPKPECRCAIPRVDVRDSVDCRHCRKVGRRVNTEKEQVGPKMNTGSVNYWIGGLIKGHPVWALRDSDL